MTSLDAVIVSSSATIPESFGIQAHRLPNVNEMAASDMSTALMLQQIQQRQLMIERLRASLALQGQQAALDRQAAQNVDFANFAPAQPTDTCVGYNGLQYPPSSTVSFLPPSQLTSQPSFLLPSSSAPPTQLDWSHPGMHPPSLTNGGFPTDIDLFRLTQHQPVTFASANDSLGFSQHTAPAAVVGNLGFAGFDLEDSTTSVMDELEAVLMSDDALRHSQRPPGSADEQSSRSSTARLDDSTYAIPDSGRQSTEPTSQSAPPPP